MKRTVLAAGLAAWLSAAVGGLENDYEELGTITWRRDYEAALAEAARLSKPVLVLFQEVPGCSTCRDFGLQVLSHPLLSEAADELFVPLAIFNNRQGKDAEVLQLYREPSWNNPVVRIVDARGRELARRLAGDYSPGGFSGVMIEALKKSGNPVPAYLRLVHEELASRGALETAYLSMFCFWQGELELAAVDGVIATRAGFVGGSEVVEVRFDSRRLSYASLLRQAQGLRCADRAFPLDSAQRETAGRILGAARLGTLDGFRPDEGTKYYLARTPLRFVPMTERQRLLANLAAYRGEDPGSFLSPRQKQALAQVRRNDGLPWPIRIASESFPEDWKDFQQRLAGLR